MVKKGVVCNYPCYFKNRKLMKKNQCILINMKPEFVKDCPCRICLIAPICTTRCDESYWFIQDYHKKMYEESRNKNMSKEELNEIAIYFNFFKNKRERTNMFFIEGSEGIEIV